MFMSLLSTSTTPAHDPWQCNASQLGLLQIRSLVLQTFLAGGEAAWRLNGWAINWNWKYHGLSFRYDNDIHDPQTSTNHDTTCLDSFMLIWLVSTTVTMVRAFFQLEAQAFKDFKKWLSQRRCGCLALPLRFVFGTNASVCLPTASKTIRKYWQQFSRRVHSFSLIQ